VPIGAKSGIYKQEFADFRDLRAFVKGGGQKGVQRPVLPPGMLAPIHPVGFLVITKKAVYGVPISDEIAHLTRKGDGLSAESFGLTPAQLDVTVIAPK